MAVMPPDPLYIIRNVDNTGVYSLAYHMTAGGEEKLLAGSKDGFVYVYNLKTKRVELKICVGDGPILHIINFKEQLIAQVKGGKYKMYNFTGTEYVMNVSFETDYSGFCRIEVDSNGEIVYAPDKDTKIHIFNIFGEDLDCLQYDDDTTKLGEVMCLKYVELSQKTLIAGYESGWILLWDTSTYGCVSKLKTKECPLTIEYNLDKEKGVIGNTSNTVHIFKIYFNDNAITHLTDITIKNPGINKVLSKNNKVFATAGWDGNVRIFKWSSLKPLAVLNEHRESVQDIAFSPCDISLWNSKVMAVASLDGSISLWDIYNDK